MQPCEEVWRYCFSCTFLYFDTMQRAHTHRWILLGALLLPWNSLIAQSDLVSYQWPVPPFGSSRNINGTFCEYRNTLSANHFHNGVDIGEPDNYPVYSGLDGIVHSLSTVDGENNFVRVRTNVGGVWKHISYVHIQPNPALSLGSAVQAGVTVLGTIYPGMGHVHVTERELVTGQSESGIEINPLRNGGGLTPYVDTYTPVIDRTTLQFRQQGLGTIISGTILFGKVDISIRVNERNGPGSPGGTQTNNGTYMIGYRVLSADSSAVVFEPTENGLRYRFDRKPLDDDVDVAFLGVPYSNTSAHYYYVTNGAGASTVNSLLRVTDSWFDTEMLPEGSYLLEIFAEDTRANTDAALFPIEITRRDLVPPSIPQLRTVLTDSLAQTIQMSWNASPEPDLGGYRVSFLSNTGWTTVVDETRLTRDSTSCTLTDMNLFLDRPGQGIQLRVSSVDTATPPNESPPSDVYYILGPGLLIDCWDGGCVSHSILIVDGFDRFGGSGSWQQPTHSFATSYGTCFEATLERVSTCSNEAVLDGTVNLLGYDCVVWFLGDESTTDNTFTSGEQLKIRSYLEDGGKLLVSGSEIGWDLGRAHPASEPGDMAFYNTYLKASYVYDGDTGMKTATGAAGTPIASLTFTFGQVYPEDYPDDINPAGGASVFMKYNTNRTDGSPRVAAIAYAGVFGAGSNSGGVVYLAFPFETISSLLQRETLMSAALQQLGLVSAVSGSREDIAVQEWQLSENYPNPFNPETVLELRVPYEAVALVRIFDLLGREVATLWNGPVRPGTHKLLWNASGLASGVYYARLEAGSTVHTRKLVLAK
jgi:hypothetical protein